MDIKWLPFGTVLRYPREYEPTVVEYGDHLNFHYAMAGPGPRLQLEAGINAPASIQATDGPRRPVIFIRSSPWKAGHDTNPWHDEFDLDHGHVRYFGDHKHTTLGEVGSTSGNRLLLEAWRLHAAPTRDERAAAPPFFLFRSKTVTNQAGRSVPKGHVEFCGIAIIERLEYVIQRAPGSESSFPNIVLDLNVINLSNEYESERVDLRWINARRDAALSNDDTLAFAPASWRQWVAEGKAALPGIRRRVLRGQVKSPADQMPPRGSEAEATLHTIYRYFDGKKHHFEQLAAQVAAQVLGGEGARYREGWLTKAGGDGGLDFVGRLDVGTSRTSTPLVVLGQAKCVLPSSTVSAEQVARVVARLQRGWIGVFVTTGAFSKQAQVEVIDDRYPLVMISGGLLVDEVLKLAHMNHGGDLTKLLETMTSQYPDVVTHRRPEEVLLA